MSSPNKSSTQAQSMTSFQMWSTVLNRFLIRHHDMPECVHDLMQRSVLRQLDSAMLIEDNLTEFPPLNDSAYGQAIPEMSNLDLMESLLIQISNDGFGKHFHQLIGEFGHINTHLSCSEDQRNDVKNWTDAGKAATFLMTDAGGSSLNQWHSRYNPETGALCVDKIWAIDAHKLDFATVVASQPGSVVPVSFQVPPEACKQLTCTKVGLPYLDGALQLGNCQGELQVEPEWMLRKGGLLAVKQFLSIIRPFFVRGLMAHVNWLSDQKRLNLSQNQRVTIEYIQNVAKSITQQWTLTRFSEDEVMALKFASNALLFDLVETQSVHNINDQRDLLAFTKMEGSSYRCFMEVYSRSGQRKC